MVVGPDGEVRFSNPAAEPLIGPDGKAIDALDAVAVGAPPSAAPAEHDGIRVGDRVYAIGAASCRPRTRCSPWSATARSELRREVAEREFVSNAAHELRNPIAGISGAIEVLRAGAKDDPAGARALPRHGSPRTPSA